MANTALKGSTIATSYDWLVFRQDNFTGTEGNRINLMNDSGVVQPSNLYINTAHGHIGIGVADPDNALEIENAGIQMKLSHNTSDFATFEVESDGHLRITTVDADASEAHISLMADGYVGIATGAPQSTLHVGGNSAQLRIGNDTATDASLCFMGNAQDFYIALDDTTDDLTIGTGTTIGSSV